MRRGPALLLAIPLAAGFSACKRTEPGAREAVRAIRSRIEARYQPPADGRLTDAQLETYLKVRRAAAGATSDAAAAQSLKVDPGEYEWIRSRIIEALAVLDARRVEEAGQESYARAIATLRDARAAAGDAATTARVDQEIAGMERERAALRKPDVVPPAVAVNAARVAPRRAAIEALGP